MGFLDRLSRDRSNKRLPLGELARRDSIMAALIASKLGFGQVVWTPEDYEKYAKETYCKNVVAFRCIDEIAKAASSVPWGLYHEEDESRDEIKGVVMNERLVRANPNESFVFLIYEWISYLLIAGNSYLQRVAPTTAAWDEPQELWVLRPDRMMKELDSKGRVAAYVYTVEGAKTKLEIDQETGQSPVLQLQLFHPTDDFYGMSPAKAASREIDTSNEAVEWNMKLLQNDARPGMIFTFGDDVTTDQWDAAEKRLRESHSGPGNAGKNLLLQGLEKAIPYTMNMAEMDFIEGGREKGRAICMAFGVPPMLVGITGDATYANYKEARLAFWENTVMWYLEIMKAELNAWLWPQQEEETPFLDYILDGVPALSPRREQQWERAQKSDFLTVDERRDLVGYAEREDGEGDVILVPSTEVTLADVVGGGSTAGAVAQSTAEARLKLREEGWSDEEIDQFFGLPEGGLQQ